MDTVQLAHFSDTHLGASAYTKLARNGTNQRETDIVQSFFRAISDIRRHTPPLIIHSGDVFHIPKPEIEILIAAGRGFRELAAPYDQHTWQPQIVVSDGNHDEQRRLGRPSPLSLLKGIEGVHIVNAGYRTIEFDPAEDNSHPALANVVIHAIPHIDLKHLDFDQVVPTDGKINILTTHGVAEGSELYRLNLTREYPIPLELMTRGWDYVALGHYHRQGPIQPGQFGTTDPNKPSRIWYAGSTDTITFSDFSGSECSQRGWLDVTINPGELPHVTPRHYPVRRYLRLPTLEVEGLDQATIEQRLIDNLTGTQLRDAVVVQKVAGVSRDLWSTVDIRRVRDQAAAAMHYELKVAFKTPQTDTPDQDTATVNQVGFGDLPQILTDIATTRITEPALQHDVLDYTTRTLTDVLGDGALDTEQTPDTDDTTDTTDTDDTTDTPDTPTQPTDSREVA